MRIQKKYTFNKKEFENNPDKNILDLIEYLEKDFHNNFKPYKANFLFANFQTLTLLKKHLNTQDELYGLDLINGKIDIDINIKIDEKSKNSKNIIYAIGSELENNRDEPIFLVKINKMANETVILKYVSDDDNDDVKNPVTRDIKTKVTL